MWAVADDLAIGAKHGLLQANRVHIRFVRPVIHDTPPLVANSERCGRRERRECEVRELFSSSVLGSTHPFVYMCVVSIVLVLLLVAAGIFHWLQKPSASTQRFRYEGIVVRLVHLTDGDVGLALRWESVEEG
jgi:hypothetical protein